jgi:multidrug efflux system membrane fusion protein
MSGGREMNRTTRHWRRCAATVTVAALVSCKGAAPKKPTPATPVRVATVASIDAPVNILASGVVEPVQTVSVTTQVTGSLLDVLFKEGDFVQAGQLMFRIDPRPLAAAVDQAKAVLARDEAQAEAGRKDDERYKKLADMGYVSRSQADQFHATAQAQTATVAADQAALRSAQVSLGFTAIRAPISGRTGSLLVRRGNNVSPGGGPLVVINQISPVLVRFPVLDQDFAAVQRAVALHPLHVKAVASDSSLASDDGQLSFLDNAVDSTTGTVTGKATFPNTARRLWPGQLVFLTVQLDVQHGVLAVPSDAVQTGQQGSYVFVVDQKLTAQSRPVATGIQVGDLTVVQKGLAAGERVVIDGQSRLNPGGRVAIVGASGDSAASQLGAGGYGSAAGTPGATAAGDIVTSHDAPNGATNGGNATPGGARGGSPTGAAAPLSPIAPARTPGTVTGTTPSTTTPSSTTPSSTAPGATTPSGSTPTGAMPPGTSTTGTTPARATTPATAPAAGRPPATGGRPPTAAPQED